MILLNKEELLTPLAESIKTFQQNLKSLWGWSRALPIEKNRINFSELLSPPVYTPHQKPEKEPKTDTKSLSSRPSTKIQTEKKDVPSVFSQKNPVTREDYTLPVRPISTDQVSTDPVFPLQSPTADDGKLPSLGTTIQPEESIKSSKNNLEQTFLDRQKNIEEIIKKSKKGKTL